MLTGRMSSGGAMSKEFVDLVKGIGEAKSKAEEDAIVVGEIAQLKAKMAERGVTPVRMRELLLRMLYVEMLGHDASFGHIHAVKMCHGTKLGEKRVGYLAVSICLHPEHELMLLLVNTLQNDLKSSNQLEVAMALIIVIRLVNKELLRALLPLVVKAVDHAQPNVRKKAVAALHRCHQINPAAIEEYLPKVQRVLCDKDPSVMGAVLPFLHDLALADPGPLKSIVPSLVSILKQVVEHRLPRDYDYRRLPAPWIQIKLIQVLGNIGVGDKAASQGMYELLLDVMKRADTGINIGYAVIYECVRTATRIYPNVALLDEAAKCVSRFITSEYHNRKYLGIDALASIVRIDTKYATEHQLVVIDCLDSQDETLRRKTLDLLFQMSNAHNVVVIVENMIRFLTAPGSDVFLRTSLVNRIAQLAEQFAPNPTWYLDTFNLLFEVCGDLVPYELAHNIFRLLSSREQDDELAGYAVKTYAAKLHNWTAVAESHHDHLARVIAFVLGEFASGERVDGPEGEQQVMHDLCRLLDLVDDREGVTRAWILAALVKCVARRTAPVSQQVFAALDRYQKSVSVDLQQRSHELFTLCQMSTSLLGKVVPPLQSFRSSQIDAKLSFLDGYVSKARAAGARPYERPEPVAEDASAGGDHLNVTPYAPGLPLRSFARGADTIAQAALASPPSTAPAEDPVASDGGLRLSGVTRKWGPGGFQAVSATSSAAPPKPPPAEHQVRPGSPESRPAEATSVVSPTRPQPPKAATQEVSEKEKRAALLFGGASARASSVRSEFNAPAQPRPPTPLKADVSPPKPKQADSIVDLLDLGSISVPGSSSGPLPPPASASSSLPDLLQALDFSAASPPIGSVFTPALEAAPHAAWHGWLMSHARAPSMDALIGSSARLQCSGLTVLDDNATLYAVIIRNVSASPVQQVPVRVASPSGLPLSVERWSGPALNAGQPARPATVLPSIAVGERELCVVRVSGASFEPGRGHRLQITVDDVSAVVDLPFHHFLRPLPLVTEQFGRLWQRGEFASGEVRSQARALAATAASLSATLAGVNVQVVQTINQETIASSKVLVAGAAEPVPVLVHIRQGPASTDVCVRCPQRALSECVAPCVSNALSN